MRDSETERKREKKGEKYLDAEAPITGVAETARRDETDLRL